MRSRREERMKPPSIERDSIVLMEDPDPNERQSVKIAKIVGCALLSLIPVCLIGKFSVGWFANPWICLSMTGVCWAVAALCHYLAKKRRNALLLLSVLINAAGCGFGIGALYLGYGAVPLDSSLSLGALGFAGAIVLFGLLYFLIPRKLVSDILCGLICLILAIVFLIFWLKGNDFCRVAFLLDVWLAGFFSGACGHGRYIRKRLEDDLVRLLRRGVFGFDHCGSGAVGAFVRGRRLRQL